MPDIYQEIDTDEFARWQRDAKPYRLIDVRDDDELELAHIPGALHIPMNQIPQRIDEIPREEAVVVICHYGVRSARVAGFLAGNGFTNVYNLDGGIDAYAERIDSTVGRY